MNGIHIECGQDIYMTLIDKPITSLIDADGSFSIFIIYVPEADSPDKAPVPLVGLAPYYVKGRNIFDEIKENKIGDFYERIHPIPYPRIPVDFSKEFMNAGDTLEIRFESNSQPRARSVIDRTWRCRFRLKDDLCTPFQLIEANQPDINYYFVINMKRGDLRILTSLEKCAYELMDKKHRLEVLKETLCSICQTRPIDAVQNCGHLTCRSCYYRDRQSRTACPFCHERNDILHHVRFTSFLCPVDLCLKKTERPYIALPCGCHYGACIPPDWRGEESDNRKYLYLNRPEECVRCREPVESVLKAFGM